MIPTKSEPRSSDYENQKHKAHTHEQSCVFEQSLAQHKEFVEDLRTNRITISIDNAVALKMVMDPMYFSRVITGFFRTQLCIIATGLLGGVSAFFWAKWYWAVLAIVASIAFRKFMLRLACEYVFEEIKTSAAFWELVVMQTRVVRIWDNQLKRFV